MRPAPPCSVRAAFCVAITSLALAGCNALLGIEEYRLGPDGAPPSPPDAPGEAPDASLTDASPDSLPPDTGPADLYLGYPDDLGGASEIPGDFLWAVEITVAEEVTLDRLGFLSRSTPISVMKLGLYAEDPLAPGQPGNLVASVQGVAVEEGACEGDVADVLLPPGTYWFAMMSDLGAELGSGTPDITHLYVNYDHNLALPESFPVTSSMLSPTLNVYLVVKP